MDILLAVLLVVFFIYLLRRYVKKEQKYRGLRSLERARNGNYSTRRSDERNRAHRSMSLMGAALVLVGGSHFPLQCEGGGTDLPPTVSIIRRLDIWPNGATIIVSGPEGFVEATIQCWGPAGIMAGMIGSYKFVESGTYYWHGETSGDFDDHMSFGIRCPIPVPNYVDVHIERWG